MKYLALFNILISVFVYSACSGNIEAQVRTGFFENYEGFERVSGDNLHYFQKLDDANLSAYDKIFIPEIKVLPNTPLCTPQENELYAQIKAYTTAAYRKNIIKRSANYSLVDVAQEGTMLMQIAISTVEVHPSEKSWDNLKAVPFALNDSTRRQYEEGSIRILIEARITDAMNQKLLARSMRVVMEEEVLVKGEYLAFKDIQASLDRWLYTSAKQY